MDLEAPFPKLVMAALAAAIHLKVLTGSNVGLVAATVRAADGICGKALCHTMDKLESSLPVAQARAGRPAHDLRQHPAWPFSAIMSRRPASTCSCKGVHHRFCKLQACVWSIDVGAELQCCIKVFFGNFLLY
jgi:hypothetical protein